MMTTTGSLAGLNVCYVSTEGYGGVWRTHKQAQALADAGACVVIAGYREFVPEALVEPPFEPLLVPSPFRDSKSPIRPLRVALNLTLNRWSNEGLTRPVSVESLRRRHQRLIDAVVATGAEVVQAVDLPSLDVAHRAAQRLGAKLVYASHELWTGFLKNPDLGISRELSRAWLEVEADLAPRANLVIVVGDLHGERLSEQYHLRARPLTLYNSPPWRVQEAAPVSDPVRLVFHGGLSADRNLEALISAMPRMRGRATLDIHGWGRTVDPAKLESLANDAGIADIVRLHGRFDNNAVQQLLAGYDVGVMTARMIEENFEIALPNKLFDCMCAGLAVAFSDSPAVREIVEDVGFGILLDPSSPETIADGLAALVTDRERVLRMKRAAVAASARYWWPEQARKLVSAFEGMLARD